MKLLYLITFLSITFLHSCRKNQFTNSPMASLTIVNAVIGGKTVKMGSVNLIVTNNNSIPMTVPVGNNDLYIWPVGDSLHPYYTKNKFYAEYKASYSLFLAGTPSSIDGILIEDNLPYHVDSTLGVRFVNLSPNSIGFNITLENSPSVKEVENLQYKQYTDFKIYPAKTNNTTYKFQVRKASDNSLLFTYNWNSTRFANTTLAIRGTTSLGITVSFNDR